MSSISRKWRKFFLTFSALVLANLLLIGLLEIGLRWTKAQKALSVAGVNTRNKLGFGPGIGAHIKLIRWEEPSKPNYAQWKNMLDKLQQANVSHVIISENFSKLFSSFTESEWHSLFLNRSFSLTLPVSIEEPSARLKSVMANAEDNPEFDSRRIVKLLPANEKMDSLTVLDRFPIDPIKVYTAPDFLVQAGKMHFGFLPVEAISPPFKRFAQQRLLSNLTFHLAKKVEILESELFIDQQAVPLFNEEFIYANFDSFEKYFQASYLFDQEVALQANDTVIIFENLNAPTINLISTAQSILSKTWLREMPFTYFWITLLSVFCLLGGLILRNSKAILLTFLVSACTVLVNLFALIQLNVLSEFLLFAVSPFVSLALSRIFHHRFASFLPRKSVSLSLHKNAAEAEVFTEFENFDGTPKGRVVSILFIDIVGFSLLAESQTPEEVFRRLRNVILNISKTVHRFGGVVDNVVGDGLLCFFGYHYDGKDTMQDHADVAIECAIEIQKQNLQEFLQSEDMQEEYQVYPLRMGINTASVFIGDLGGTKHVKPTIIGHGVNYAKRLEEACEGFRIMVGPATRDLLTREGKFSASIQKRPIQIKHHGQLFEAFEIDPFENNVVLREKALNVYRKNIGIERKDTRLLLPDNIKVLLKSNNGDGEVVNFSYSGFAVKMQSYLAKDVSMTVTLDSEDGDLGEMFKKIGLNLIVAEVKWGKPISDGFLHGFLIKNMSAEQKDQVIQIIRTYSRQLILKSSKKIA